MDRYLTVPFGEEEAVNLKSGDYVYLSGIIYTARDGKDIKECRKCWSAEKTFRFR